MDARKGKIGSTRDGRPGGVSVKINTGHGVKSNIHKNLMENAGRKRYTVER